MTLRTQVLQKFGHLTSIDINDVVDIFEQPRIEIVSVLEQLRGEGLLEYAGTLYYPTGRGQSAIREALDPDCDPW